MPPAASASAHDVSALATNHLLQSLGCPSCVGAGGVGADEEEVVVVVVVGVEVVVTEIGLPVPTQ